MGCRCGGRTRVVVHQNTRPDGVVKRFLTEQEARADQAAYGGTYSTLTQSGR